MGYVALKEIKIRADDGSYVVRQPGDPVPEALGWRNLPYWIKGGHVGLADETTTETPEGPKTPKRRKPKAAVRKVSKKGARRERA